MKISLTQLLAATLFVTLAAASDLKGQEVLERKVSLDVVDRELRSVLRDIENQTRVTFTYRTRIIEASRKVTLRVDDAPLAEVLQALFSNNVTFLVRDDEILLKPAATNAPVVTSSTGEPVLLEVQGTVYDEAGNSLPGVNVLEKGTTNGMSTDSEGSFRLNVAGPESVLVFSFIGYITEEIVVGNRTNISVTLRGDVQALEEVVVVGYGSAQKKDLTGAVTRVDMERSRLLPNVNPVQSIRGVVAGVNVVDNGRPGSDASIIIRGRNSISASNAPLIVLDGIIYSGNLADINANDIESIDILKDASSSAIYGSLAANGVILITTKKGTSRKPRISLNSYYGKSDYAHVPRFLNAEKYIQMRKDAEAADGGPIGFSPLEQANIDAGKTIEPFEEIKQNAPVYSNELSVSGTSENFTYYMSGSHTSIKSPVKGDNFERIGARVNLDVQVTDWLRIGTNSGYTAKDNSGVRANLAAAGYLSPYADLYYEDGVPRPLPMNVGLIQNPLTGTLLNKNLSKSNTLFTNAYLDVALPLEGLSFRLNTGYTQRNSKVFNYRPSFNRETFFNLGSASQSHSESRDLTVENILKYERVLGQDHVINFTGLYGIYTSQGESASLSSENIFNDALGYHALEIGENFSINTGAGKDQQLSMMGRIGYRYKGRYMIDVTTRRDGYSAFGAGNKFGLFPSAGVSWVMSEEPFLSSANIIDNLKLRVSWGKNGNRGVSRYSSQSNITQINYVFGDGAPSSVGLYTSSMANPNLGWETTTSTNIGVDFGLFSNRIGGALEFYHSNTYDLLLQQRIPNLSGYTTFLRNIGETENRGIELTLNTVNIQKNNFSWNTSIAFSLNRNKILKLSGNDLNGDGVEDDDIASGWFIGQPLGAHFDYVFDGIYQIGDDLSLLPGAKPGHIRFKDVNGDGSITPEDRQIVGSDQPDFLTGISNTFSYKGFSLLVMVYVRQGGISPNPNVNPGRNFYYEANILDVPYWTPENPINTHPILNYPDPLGWGFYQDRSYVRLQDVSLSYDLPQTLLSKLRIENLKVYLSGKNLMTWTDWNGWDPENGMIGRTTSSNGPVIKSYTLGLNIQL